MEALLPLALHRLVRVFPIAADATVAPLGGEVAIEPRSDLFSKDLLLSGEAQVHWFGGYQNGHA